MRLFKASSYPYEVILSSKNNTNGPFPLLRDDTGNEEIWSVSPVHGRSFVVGKSSDGNWIVSKGNGLNYTTSRFVSTGRGWQDPWGMLGKEHATRDFLIGEEIHGLDIKTNEMEYVLELEHGVLSPYTKETIRPCLLQYRVECPYRISDFAFMPREEFQKQVNNWDNLNRKGFGKRHLIAANVLIENLRILHNHKILHNGIHTQNYTWALELLDFEGSRTPAHPYDSADYETLVLELIDGEVIQTYEVINYIAWCLGEILDAKAVDKLFKENGFALNELKQKVK